MKCNQTEAVEAEIRAEREALADDSRRFSEFVDDLREGFYAHECQASAKAVAIHEVRLFEMQRRDVIARFLNGHWAHTSAAFRKLLVKSHQRASQGGLKAAQKAVSGCCEQKARARSSGAAANERLASIVSDRVRVLKANENWMESALRACRKDMADYVEDCVQFASAQRRGAANAKALEEARLREILSVQFGG